MHARQIKYLPSLQNEQVEWGRVIVMIIIILLLPPFIGLPITIANIANKKNASKTQYYTFFVCIALYFSAINATKVPSGDQIQYLVAYQNVPKLGFLKSLIYIYGADFYSNVSKTTISGEFMNGVYNYIGYYLTLGYYPLFAVLLTFVDYMLIFLGLYQFCRSLRKPHIPIVCGAITISFFYLFFNYTLQIQKQFLAQSIMMYVLGNYAYHGRMYKKDWIIAICAVFTHAATLLFIPFLLFKPLHRPLSKNGLIMMGIVFAVMVISGPQMASSVTSDSNSALTYGVNRLAQSETNNDTQESALVLSQILVIALPMAVIIGRKLWIERKTLSNSNAFMLNITMLLLLTIAAMFKQPLAQYRYFMMLLAFMPFIYPFAFNNINKRDKLLKIIAVVMIIWFYYQFEKIVWTYAAEWEIIVKSPLVLIADNYYTY